MKGSASAPARVAAASALALGVIVLIIVVAGSLSNGGDDSGAPATNGEPAGQRDAKPPRRTYVVQNGDTLTSISEKTGVPVARIQQLNSSVDPQILISGEKLKLR